MEWLNYDTIKMDKLDTFPDTPEAWEPYIPKHRRAEFWLSCRRLPEQGDILALAYHIFTSEVTTLVRESSSSEVWEKLYFEMFVMPKREYPKEKKPDLDRDNQIKFTHVKGPKDVGE